MNRLATFGIARIERRDDAGLFDEFCAEVCAWPVSEDMPELDSPAEDERVRRPRAAAPSVVESC
ncbi:MAG: hypothetical protein ACREAA_19580 [Candidatus Polarisedimenticolia bacterium]